MTIYMGDIPHALFSALADELRASDFQGKTSTNITDRIAVSTDNSLYQIVPELVIKPDSVKDAEFALKLLNKEKYKKLPIVVRAGGTGTNGQSLNASIILDLGRHLNNIRELNLNENWIEVDSGIILSVLNDFLAEHNVFFPPTTSTANRCSIGGMIGTDAAGKGSRIYGKTSDHVLALDVLLVTGERIWLEPKQLDRLANSTRDKLCRDIHKTCMSKRDLVQKTFPKINRRLSGYDLETSVSENGHIDPTRIICGSEGTLAIVLGARLKLMPIPKYKRLVVLAYSDFIEAVASAQTLLPFDPAAIETVDDVIQEKALQGPLGKLLPKEFHPNEDGGSPPICNFVEFIGDEEKQVNRQAQKLIEAAKADPQIRASYLAESLSDQTALWNARKAAVGLLADCPPGPQPAAFVEDCVVPPENLADFLTEFRALLDREKTSYGMFGHVDVGCIHVRPALNQNKNDVVARMRYISDEVQKLAIKYNGLLWGEHGKGFRGEYLEETVGSEVYEVMREIKTLFDPDGRLNPGKLASPLRTQDIPITKIDQAPMRSTRNRQVHENNRLEKYADAFRCNGNAQCLNSTMALHMCPSFKATGDLRFSPKGRADLLREWLRLDAENSTDLKEFEKELYPVLDTCLSCKACTSSCPVHVDIPELKSRFLETYHSRHSRPLRDHSFAYLENFSAPISRMPALANLIMRNPIANLISSQLGIKDSPAASNPSVHKRLASKEARIWSPEELVDAINNGGTTKPPAKFVVYSPVILVDGFNLAYDAECIEDIYNGMCKLGFYPFMVYAGASGKALHVKGFREQFKIAAHNHVEALKRLKEIDLPIVAAESSYLATLTKDYKAIGEDSDIPKVVPLHQYLTKHIDHFKNEEKSDKSAKYFAHCTEKTSMPDIDTSWKEILLAAGINLTTANTGCCGMSGAYGHEAQHQETSKKLYDLTWKREIDTAADDTILATGFSCRCQVKRMSDKKAYHPLRAVLDNS